MDLVLDIAGTNTCEDIPAASVFLVMQAFEGQYPDYPDATASVRFLLGDTVYTRVVNNDFDALVDSLAAFPLVKVISGTQDCVVLFKREYLAAILTVQDFADKSLVIITVGQLTFDLLVKGSRNEVKTQIEASSQPPIPVLVEPAPVPRPRTPRKTSKPSKRK